MIDDSKKFEDAFPVQRGNTGKRRKSWRGQGESGAGITHPRQPEKTFRGNCHFCQERRHFARDYPKRKAKFNPHPNSNRGKGKGSANCVESEKDDEINQEALFTSNVASKSCWIIDSGATQHMTFEKNRLSDYILC